MGSPSKQPAARMGDIASNHGPWPPTPIIAGSGNVLINSIPAARKGDAVLLHAIPNNPPHPRSIAEGVGSVKINGIPAARVSDAISCGGKVAVGSGNVLIGDKPEKARNSKVDLEFEELLNKSISDPKVRQYTPHQKTQLAADIAVKYRGEQGAVDTWHDYYMSNDPTTAATSAAEAKGLKNAQEEKARSRREDEVTAKQVADNNALNQTSQSLTEAMLAALVEHPQDELSSPILEEITSRILDSSSVEKESTVNIQSFAEAVERLQQARDNIVNRKSVGEPPYKPKYTDEELLQKVENGSVANERFLVSIQPKDDSGDATLAFERDSGLVPAWTTSLDQIEAADTDPELIHQVLGAESNYDPDKDYVMHIIDRGENLDQFGNNSIVPTWENLSDAAVNALGSSYEADIVRSTMNMEYQAEYADKMTGFWDNGLNEFNHRDVAEYVESLPENEAVLFNTRHKIRAEIGANSEFTGNGLTANTAEGGGKYGVVETLSLERNLPDLASLHEDKIVKTIDLTPI
ncbi:PAAR domain-containing protein [Aurantivibrio plasticivorans]